MVNEGYSVMHLFVKPISALQWSKINRIQLLENVIPPPPAAPRPLAQRPLCYGVN